MNKKNKEIILNCMAYEEDTLTLYREDDGKNIILLTIDSPHSVKEDNKPKVVIRLEDLKAALDKIDFEKSDKL